MEVSSKTSLTLSLVSVILLLAALVMMLIDIYRQVKR